MGSSSGSRPCHVLLHASLPPPRLDRKAATSSGVNVDMLRLFTRNENAWNALLQLEHTKILKGMHTLPCPNLQQARERVRRRRRGWNGDSGAALQGAASAPGLPRSGRLAPAPHRLLLSQLAHVMFSGTFARRLSSSSCAMFAHAVRMRRGRLTAITRQCKRCVVAATSKRKSGPSRGVGKQLRCCWTPGGDEWRAASLRAVSETGDGQSSWPLRCVVAAIEPLDSIHT